MRALVIFGTRPEAIKLAPVIERLQTATEVVCRAAVTSQHQELLQQVLDLFGVHPDVDLDLMRPNQRPLEFFSRACPALQAEIELAEPDYVILQGDTMTCFAASLSAALSHKHVLHVEAGLRTHDRHAPFPEEMLRTMVSDLASVHCAPTLGARQNLVDEGIAEDQIWVTGNTVVDALQSIQPRLSERKAAIMERFGLRDRFVLVTGHRRENFGRPFQRIFQALRKLALDHPEVDFIYPVHPNPNVSIPAHDRLRGVRNMKLVEPLDYLTFLALMSTCQFVISDSGGVQEEAPSLGKKVLVTREVTERPELVDCGLGVLVGSNRELIVKEAQQLITHGVPPDQYVKQRNPFGDGLASERIIQIILSGSCDEFQISSGV